MPGTLFPLVIEKGRTLSQAVRWEAEPFLSVPVSGISNAASAVISTALPHGIPNGWRVALVGVKGPSELNASKSPPAPKDFKKATVVSSTSVELNGVSTAASKSYAGGGFLQFYSPVDLTGYVARMHIKRKVDGDLLLSLGSVDGRIALDVSGFTITIQLTATETAALSFTSGVYDLEVESPTGVVTCILTGPVSVTKEVTS